MKRTTADGWAGRSRWRDRCLWAALVLIVLAAGALRIHGIAFGLPALLDPDELIFMGGAHELVASGNGNPGWFGHPATTTMYVLGLVGSAVFAVGLLTGQFTGPDTFVEALFLNPGLVVHPARVVMAMFGVACTVLTWRLGARLAGPVGGLVAGALMAVNPVLVTWSQVVRSDMMALTFLLLTALAGDRLLDEGRRRHLLLACLFTALAITSKWPFAVSFLIIVGALIVRHGRSGHGSPEGWVALLGRLAVAGLLVLLMVIAISPYLILDYPTLLSNLQGEAKVRHLGGMRDGVVGNLGYYLGDPLWRGLGAGGAVLAAAGLVFARQHVRFWVLVGIPAAVMLVLILSQAVVWERWAVPLFPALSIAAGIAAERLARRIARSRFAGLGVATGVVVAMVTLALPLGASLAGVRERMNDNRKLATDWAQKNLPPGSSLMVEHFAFDMVSSPYPIIFPIGTAGCIDARAVLRGKINYKTVDSLRGGQSNLDYAAVPEDKQASCQADFAILTEHARYAADREFFPAGHRRYERLIASGRIIARFSKIPGKVGGRPEVIVVDLRERKGP